MYSSSICFKGILFVSGVIFLVGCRSTTPMTGIQQAQSTNSKISTGVSISLNEPSTESPGADNSKKENLECIFGKSIGDIANSSDFELEKRGTVERMAASKNLEGKTLLFAYTEYLHKVTNTRYSVYNTFLNSVDGGVTKGWIQTSLSQEVVAEVDDGDIINCTVISQKDKKIENYSDESCLFGLELNSLMESSQFKISLDRELFRLSKIPGEGKRRQKYRLFKISDIKSNKLEYSMYLRLSDIQGSKNFNGWIETNGDLNLVALIGESEIYECIVDSSGSVSGKIADVSASCLFGKDIHDLEVSLDFVLSNLDADVTMSSRIRKNSRPKVFKRRALLHKPTGRSYIVFHTYRDEDDNGKTQGWIETIDGRLVAEIFENAFRSCQN